MTHNSVDRTSFEVIVSSQIPLPTRKHRKIFFYRSRQKYPQNEVAKTSNTFVSRLPVRVAPPVIFQISTSPVTSYYAYEYKFTYLSHLICGEKVDERLEMF